jgi:hypothetical protein
VLAPEAVAVVAEVAVVAVEAAGAVKKTVSENWAVEPQLS